MIFRNIYLKLIYIIFFILLSAIFYNNKIFAENNSSQKPLNIWEMDEDSQIDEANYEEEESSKTLTDNRKEVERQDFQFSKTDAIGIYDTTNGGLSSNIWKGSKIKNVEYLLSSIPLYSSSSTLNDLILKALLSVAAPPENNLKEDISYLELKSKFLVDRGYYEKLYSLSLILEDNYKNKILNDGIIKYFLIFNKHKLFCKTENIKKFTRPEDLYLIAFCNAMSANKLAFDMNIAMIREEKSFDSDYLSSLSKIVYNYNIEDIKISELDLFILNLLVNYKHDIETFITEESSVEFKIFYLINSKKNNYKKISIAEELVKKGIINFNLLADLYQSFELKNDINSDEINTAIKNRIKIYKKIRNTSSQSELIKLLPEFINLFVDQHLLKPASLMIYDKLKVIQPKGDYLKYTTNICLIFILNDDSNRCNEWANKINFSNDYLKEFSKVKFYISLRDDVIIEEKYIDELIKNTEISNKQKNIIVRYYELITNTKKIDYWQSRNDLNKVSSITTNIKLHNYFYSLEDHLGEKLLLLNLINGDNKFEDNDEFSTFLIIDGLYEINKSYAREFILEYFTKYNL